MGHNLQHAISLLTRTAVILRYASACSTGNLSFRNEGENTWGAFDAVALWSRMNALTVYRGRG